MDGWPSRYSLFRGSFLRSANKTTASYDPQEPINRIARSMTVASAQVIPDMEGWLHKQGDKYKTWNRRWFVLKGSNLFYFKNPKVRFSLVYIPGMNWLQRKTFRSCECGGSSIWLATASVAMHPYIQANIASVPSTNGSVHFAFTRIPKKTWSNGCEL